MHPQHQPLSRSDSPPDRGKQNLLHQLHSQDTSFNVHSLQSGLYSIPNGMHIQSEYLHEFDTTKLQQQQTGKPSGFGANNNFRASFSSFPNTNRPRHQLNPSVIAGPSFRDQHNFYPTSADVFPPQVASPIQPHLQPYDSHNTFDFGSGQAGLVGGHKSYLDSFNSPSNLLQGQHSAVKSGVTPQQSSHIPYNTPNYHSNSIQLASQTPYGPHLPANVLAGNAVAGLSQGVANMSTATSMNSNIGVNGSNQEEISTIFVVGFPEDMQEREFQNMFTFSPGFEAATLKIPNKEYTSYSGLPSGVNGVRSYQGYSGSNDPYNLVTVNQGGVVVDGGRDGTMSSWPAAVTGDDATGHFLGGSNMPPRKQIIGFAKFRSREEALGARDVLQGRRVDIEKGAVLKAEMAKKNLHTKRGVGPVPGAVATAAPVTLAPTNPLPNLQYVNGVSLSGSNPDPFTLTTESYSARDRDPGPLGGVNLGRLGAWRDQLQQDVHSVTNGIGAAHSAEFIPRKDREDEEQRRRERDANLYSAMGFGTASSTRGPRERAEEEERDRRRKEKDARLRASNSTAFDAFHSIPPGGAPTLSRRNSNINGSNGHSLLPPMEGSSSLCSSPLLGDAYAASHNLLPNHSSQSHQHYQSVDEMVGPWDTIQHAHPNNVNVVGPRAASQRSPSPNDGQDPRHSPSEGRPFAFNDEQNRQHRSQSESSGSSVVGSHTVGHVTSSFGGTDHLPVAELSRSMSDLILSTENGNNSPELPSPASGASSVSTRNAIDQNPPINTLYVGNLPTSPPPVGFPQDYLEESLRQLFIVQPGFRRLCFRQKSNGPMCFVEFEDVNYASKALNDLYGNTLKGLIKGGGIRLSYSKNPLGVRTPTSATGSNNGSLQQQQGMQSMTFHTEQFQPRTVDDYSQASQQSTAAILRREANGLSPAAGPSYNNSFLTSPPPRFSTSPPMNPFGAQSSTSLNNAPSSFALRGNGGSLSTLYSYNLAAPGSMANNHSPSTTFSPFGVLTPSIPEQSSASDAPSSLHSSQHFIHRNLSPPTNNIEATRAG